MMLLPSILGIMVSHQCVSFIGRSRYTAVETIVWLGQSAFVKLKTVNRGLLVGFNCNSGIMEFV